MKKYIVTTTINNITKALDKYDNLEGWDLIVIGDKKTPDLKLKNGLFIPHQEQENLGFESVKHIPWNIIQRRNVGYLYALREGADVIATIDDDNIPYDHWGKSLHVGSNFKSEGVWNELVCDSLFEYETSLMPRIWHRGYPIQRLDKRNNRIKKDLTGFVEVQAGLWNGEPDVDAVCRIANGPFNLNFEHKTVMIDNKCYSPYNTQNTIFTRRIAPAMCLLFDIGRMDDIWASYACQRIMRELGSNVLFTEPTVFQDRNEHDLSVDLQAEMIGYRNTLSFLEMLESIEFTDVEKQSVINMYERIVKEMSNLDYISERTNDFQFAWLEDIRRIYA